MKILIIGLAKIKYMPYLNFYLNSISFDINEVHVCYWNRDGKKEDLTVYSNAIFHEFVFKQFNSVKKFNKIKPFLLYRKFVLKLMKQEQFDFVIFLHSLSGILIKDRLKKQQYIFDYRDSTYEANMLFRHMIHSLVNGSYATFISSQGFLSYLPQTDKVYISHNLLLDSLKHREYQKILSEKIRICFWGHIRNVSVNKLLIEKIAKDDRFELHYYGREQGAAIALKEYCQENSLSNIFFHGEYEPSERYNFVKATDFIHNIYDDSNMQIAMGNKYYDGLIFKIPQLCTVGSFMGAQVQEKGVGIAVDPGDDALLSKIYDFYISLNRTVFEDNCETELKRVLAQYEVGQRLIGELGK